LAFQFGRQSGLRTTGEVIEQLKDQLRSERQRNAEANLSIAELRQDLAQARWELARRDTLEAFRALPCIGHTLR
jgi:hypothetical protein